MVWYGMVRYGMVWHGMAWHGMAWYSMVRYGTVWHGTAWYGTVWHGMAMLWYAIGKGSISPEFTEYIIQRPELIVKMLLTGGWSV